MSFYSAKHSHCVVGSFQSDEKRTLFFRSFTKKQIKKVLMIIGEKADVFLNLANFAPHTFFNIAPPHSWVLGIDNLAKWQKKLLQPKTFWDFFGHKSADS